MRHGRCFVPPRDCCVPFVVGTISSPHPIAARNGQAYHRGLDVIEHDNSVVDQFPLGGMGRQWTRRKTQELRS